MTTTNDPGNYERLKANQFQSADEGMAALIAFHAELAELRKKHRVLDISYTCLVSTPERPIVICGHMGDSRNHLTMAARAFGYAKAEQERYLAGIVKQGEAEGTVVADEDDSDAVQAER